MVRCTLAAFVALATSACMLICSAQPDFDTICEFLPLAACVQEAECGDNGNIIFECSGEGQVCCRNRPTCGERELPPHKSEACVAEDECGADGQTDTVAQAAQCPVPGQVCCVTTTTLCEALHFPTGVSATCVPEDVCTAVGPRSLNFRNRFQCPIPGDACCVTGTPEQLPSPGGPRQLPPIPGQPMPPPPTQGRPIPGQPIPPPPPPTQGRPIPGQQRPPSQPEELVPMPGR